MSETKLAAILATVAILAIVLFVSNFNIQININGKGNDTANQKTTQASGQPQGDSMASHHGGGARADSTVFNNLTGRPAPDFSLESYDGKTITLSRLRGSNVILFFNEGLMCYPACWNQIAAFGKDTDLSKKAVILNITADPKNNWKQAIDKMPELASATVVFDSSRQVSQAYGVLTLPSSMHKGQFPGHSYVIINKEGIVKFVKDDIQMVVRNQELAAEIDKL